MRTRIISVLLLLIGIQWNIFVFAQEMDTLTIKLIACETLQEAYVDEYQHEKGTYDSVNNVSLLPIVSEGVTYFYAVNVRNEQGWALVSNEERYVPVVAYSLRGNIDVNDSDSLWYRFLEEHIDAIDSIRAYNVTTPRISIKRQRIMSGTPSQGTANRVVLPIIGNLEWRQGIIDSNHCEKSYNRYCPEKENNPKYCDRAPVGCTGVAMAMIMRYWNWPDYTEDNNMEKHYLDWGAIPDVIYSYTPTHEAHMLAHLLYDCGVAANSHYRKNYTWATIEAARGGF